MFFTSFSNGGVIVILGLNDFVCFHHRKKAWKKKKKKQKQVAGQKRADMQQRTNTVASRQVSMSTPMQRFHQIGSNNAVVQNKENKVFSLQIHLDQTGTTADNQNERFAFSREATARSFNQPRGCDQFTQSTHQWRNDNNFSINNQHVNVEQPQMDKAVRPPNTQEAPRNTLEKTRWPVNTQHNYYNRDYDKDFTSDHLPQSGAINFDWNESTITSHPGQEGSRCSTNPSLNKSVSTAPIRDVDVSVMLKQIRRALGVREPCRAEREAKRRNNEAGAQMAGTEREQGAAFRNHKTSPATSVEDQLVNNTPAGPAAFSGASSKVYVESKLSTFKMAQETPQNHKKDYALADGLSNRREAQGGPSTSAPLRQCLGTTITSEPTVNITRKVRIAHEPGNAQGVKETRLKSTQNKFATCLSGVRGMLRWRETYEEMKRKKKEDIKGTPR